MYLEIKMKINVENVEQFDNWIEQKPDCIEKVKFLNIDELEQILLAKENSSNKNLKEK